MKTAFPSFVRIAIVTVLLSLLLPAAARAGDGTYSYADQYQFKVWIQWNATDDEVDVIASYLAAADQYWVTALRRSQRWARIDIFVGDRCTVDADMVIKNEPGRSNGTYGLYGVHRSSIVIYWPTVQGYRSPAMVFVHEMGHHALGLADEYERWPFFGTCAPPGASHCVMQDPNHDPRRTTFCDASNHDPDRDTVQHFLHRKSCWEVIYTPGSPRIGFPFGGTLVSNPRIQVTRCGARNVEILVDTSGSMSATYDGKARMDWVKDAARTFVDLMDPGEGIGITHFDCPSAFTRFRNQDIDFMGAVRDQANNAIRTLPSPARQTNITAGLIEAMGNLRFAGPAYESRFILLLSDGDHNCGAPSPTSLIPQLKAAGIRVCAVGISPVITPSGQLTLQSLAGGTGGLYYHVKEEAGLPKVIMEISAFMKLHDKLPEYDCDSINLCIPMGLYGDTTGDFPPILEEAPEAMGFAGDERAAGESVDATLSMPMPVADSLLAPPPLDPSAGLPFVIEPGGRHLTLALSLQNPADAYAITIRSPSGQVYTRTRRPPGGEYHDSFNVRGFEVPNPEPGTWLAFVAPAGPIWTGRFSVNAWVDHAGTSLVASAQRQSAYYPSPITVTAYMQHDHEVVRGATIEGTVLRPTGPPVGIRLYDDGLAAHGDAVAEDGLHSAIFRNFSSLGNGTYSFRLVGSVPEGALTMPGESLFDDAPENTKPVPAFARSTVVSAWRDLVPALVPDAVPPDLIGIPPDVTLGCDEVPPPADVRGIDDRDGDVPASLTERREPGPCDDSYALVRTWTAEDSIGNVAQGSQRITVVDDVAPGITGVPPSVAVECDAVPAPATPFVTDNCDPAPAVEYAEARIGGPCPNRYELQRTWTAFDRCGNEGEEVQVITVDDTTPPVLAVPAPVRADCAAGVPAADPLSVSATDGCPGDVVVTHAGDVVRDRECENRFVIDRTYRATDACGNFTDGIQVITVNDTTPPVVTPPAALSLECASDVPVPDPSSVSATDDCGGAVTVTHASDVVRDRTCPNRFVLERTYRATDACGNAAEAVQVITVNDTTPPVVERGSGGQKSLCPPNHAWACFSRADFSPVIADNCDGGFTWGFVDCASAQPTDGTGDGHTSEDCAVSPDGEQFCVRAERQGGGAEGRTYQVSAVAVDACGNATREVIGLVHVPHDQRANPDCLDMTAAGGRSGRGLPW